MFTEKIQPPPPMMFTEKIQPPAPMTEKILRFSSRRRRNPNSFQSPPPLP
jgi:hypothetical protein